MNDEIKKSYSAAGVLPVKVLLHDRLIQKMRREGKIMPIHIQLCPTNKCNLNCAFCSCSERDKSLELSYDDIDEIMTKAKRCGCESVTITGGGEPIMHPDINRILARMAQLHIEVGMVTNGYLLGKMKSEDLKRIRWIRISMSDDREMNDNFRGVLSSAILRDNDVDWSFSYVLTRSPNYDLIEEVIRFANENRFTHIRIVSDILDLDDVPDMGEVKREMEERGVNDRIVIYQSRKEYGSGNKKCLISLLKPTVAADGYLYPCCGVQYALEKPRRDFEPSCRIGLAKNIDRLYESQRHFDGSVCKVCYYTDYNWILNLLTSDIKHEKFL